MSLQKWLEYGWLHPHKSSREEISDLLRIVDRDLQDAAGDISAAKRKPPEISFRRFMRKLAMEG